MSTKTTAPKATKATSALIEDLILLDDQIKALTEQRTTLSDKLVDRIGEPGTSVESELALVTVVQNTTPTLDFEALNLLRPTWARRVTRKVFDAPKFSLLLKAGEVPADVVELVEMKASKPFPKITRR